MTAPFTAAFPQETSDPGVTSPGWRVAAAGVDPVRTLDHTELVTWPPFRNLQQPWLFVYYAVAFGGLTYLIQGGSPGGAVVGGLVFAIAMSLWHERRQRSSRKRIA